MTWLWALYSNSFEKAFAKSGRIDVDPECKWLIRAAVDASIRAIMSEIAENGATPKHNSSGGDVSAASSVASTLISDGRVAAIVSEALTKEVCIDSELVRNVKIGSHLFQQFYMKWSSFSHVLSF